MTGSLSNPSWFSYLWTAKFPIARLLQVAVGIHAALFLLIFALIGPNFMVNLGSACLVLLLDAFLIVFLYWADNRSKPCVIILVLFTGVFFLPRLITYLLLPSELIEFPFESGFYHGDLNRALSFILIGNFLLVAGLIVGTRVFPTKTMPEPDDESLQPGGRLAFTRGAILGTWIIVLAINEYFFILRGASIFDLSTVNVPGLWLIYFFNPDTLAIITIALALTNKPFFEKHWAFIIVILVIYLLSMLIGGSRGGLLRIGQIIILVMLAWRGNFQTSLKTVVPFCLTIILLSAALYPIGSAIRYMHVGLSPGASVHLIMDELGIKGLPPNSEVGPKERCPATASIMLCYISPIAARLGILDYPIEVLSERGDRKILGEYLNLSYTAKNVINNSVLGTPFPEAEISTSRTMPLIFRGATLDHVKKNYISEPWTLWGLVYVLFGWWGGLASLFLFGLLSQVLLSTIYAHFGSFKYVIAALFLSYFTFSGFYTFGLDSWLTILGYLVLSFLTSFMLLFGLNQYRSMFISYLKRTRR